MRYKKPIANRQRHLQLKTRAKRSAIILVAAAVLVGAIAPSFSQDSPVAALDNSAKIKALELQISTYNDRARELAAQSDSLAKAIDVLKNEQAQLQAEIDLNNAKAADLKAKIADN